MTMARSHRILIADNNPKWGFMLHHLVEHFVPTARITVVWDGAMVLAAHELEPADLIITDYHMPYINGIELIRQLRACHDTTPIVLCSLDDISDSACAIGASRFVSKVELFPALAQAIGDLLPPERWAYGTTGIDRAATLL
jgi:CheY-like chemotaxis protein